MIDKALFPKKLFAFFLLLVFFNPAQLAAQVVITTQYITAQQFVETYFAGDGITVSNATINGFAGLNLSVQIANFVASGDALTELGIASGIFLTSGYYSDAGSPNLFCGVTSGYLNSPSDADLEIISGNPMRDAIVLEFDFVPSSDSLKLRYTFGSEEFFFRCNTHNDAMGIFLSGPGISGPFSNTGVDIALLPGSLNYVTTNNICADSSVCWCNSPFDCPPDPANPNPVPSYYKCTNPHGHGLYLDYNAFTYVLTASHSVSPCFTYHLKIAIADGIDYNRDSGLFLEKGSLTSTGLVADNTYAHPEIHPGAIEGCSDATVTFHNPGPVITPTVIHYSISGTAVMGVDYSPIPDSVTIPAGQSDITLTIHPLTDNTPEGIETVIITGNPLPCGPSTLNDTIRIYDNTTVTVNAGNDTTICLGSSVTLHASPAGGLSPYDYTWSTGSHLQNIVVTPVAGINNYSVSLTDACGGNVVDDKVVTALPIPSVTNFPLNKSICTGESTNIPLTSSVPGTNFHWTATLTSGTITGFSADSGLVINQVLTNSLITSGTIVYHITPKIGNCVGTSVDYQVTVNPGIPVQVNISASVNNICPGTPVTFTSLPVNGGPNPTYKWFVNSVFTGNTTPNYSFTPVNSDVVNCELTSSNLTCILNNPAISNSITMTVNPNLPVSITISPNPGVVCQGQTTTFTATPTHGGTNPSYQWYLNSNPAGANSDTYTFSPVNGDIVSCTLTSSELCTTNNPAYSIQHTVSVSPGLPLSITITASSNPFCPGSSVTFTATPVNGGSTPSYQWKVNGNNTGTNSTYTYNPVNGDSVRCIMTSNLSCVTGSPASSAKIIMSGTLAPIVTFTSCFDTITRVNAKPIKLKGGIPLGGTYSGPGVNSITSVFTPALAGTGTHTITYSYMNAALCTASKSISILNLPSSVLFCGNALTDPRDNKVYQTVQIGAQCWMAEDLNYGTEIPSNQDQRDNCVSEKYHNPASSIQHPASVYQWDELMTYDDTPADQGFCTPGWHIPSENDWNILFANYINSAFAGSPLKYSGYSGFNALLSGVRDIKKGWEYQGFATFFWSSTPSGSIKAWAHGMNEVDPSVSLYPSSRVNAFSVRCLKD